LRDFVFLEPMTDDYFSAVIKVTCTLSSSAVGILIEVTSNSLILSIKYSYFNIWYRRKNNVLGNRDEVNLLSGTLAVHRSQKPINLETYKLIALYLNER
jgi:hypothetical protein